VAFANHTAILLTCSLVLAGNTVLAQEDTAIQVNLDKKGQISKDGLKGKKSGTFGQVLKQYDQKPDEVGDQIQVIRIYEYNGPDDGPSALMDEDGKSTHAHAGATDPPYNQHCHQWVKVGPTWYLVHCQP
jgi:hypothetical protein